MSIKGTSVEVIVVLVVFPPLLYMRDRNIYLSPLTWVIEKSVGMTGLLRRVLLSPPLYGWDRSKRSQGKGFEELVIDESEALRQIRSISNFLLQDECSFLYQGSLLTHLLCNGSSGSGCTSYLYRCLQRLQGQVHLL